MDKKKIILFDIDKTLLDTNRASEVHQKMVLDILGNPDFDLYQKIREEYRSSLKNEREYNPKEFYKRLCTAFNFGDINSLLDIHYSKKNWYVYKNAVFGDVIKTLESLKNKFRLGIYSEALFEFQINKFNAMGISVFFDKDLIFIFDAKDEEKALEKIPKEAIVVDDKERICEFLTDHAFKAIWINRKDERKSEKFETIHSLLEIENLINNPNFNSQN